MNPSQLVDVIFKVSNSREQQQKQGDTKWNATFLLATLKVSNLKKGSHVAQWYKESVCQCRRYKGLEFDPWVRKIPLEEKMTTYSSILACRIP